MSGGLAMVRRTMTAVVVLGAVLMAGATGVTAQEPEQAQPGPRAIPRVEAIMQMRDRLELSDRQVAELDAIRREIVAQRSAERAELDEMRSRLAAGQIRRSELMAFMEERQDGREGLVEQRRGRIEAVLTEEQVASLEELRASARAFARGRASAMRGDRGPRGRPMLRGGRDIGDARPFRPGRNRPRGEAGFGPRSRGLGSD